MRKTLEDRLIDGLAFDLNGGCWLWTGSDNGSGYGKIGFAGRNLYVHRVAYELWIGRVPRGLHLDHLCRVSLCCNPHHLEPVENGDNTRRGRSIGETHHNARLTNAQAASIKKRLAEGEEHKKLAAEFGISRRTVGYISTGERWVHAADGG